MVLLNLVTVVAFLILQNVCVLSIRDGQSLKAELLNLVNHCIQPNILKSESRNTRMSSCFFACVFKKTKFMNGAGQFDVKSGLAYFKKYLHGVDKKRAQDILDYCLPKSKASYECERGYKMASCIVDSVRSSQREFADTDEFQKVMMKNVDVCATKFNLSILEIVVAFVTKVVHTLDPCFLGCVLESGGLINETGHVQVEGALKRYRKLVNDAQYKNLSLLFHGSAKLLNGKVKDICDSGKILTPFLMKELVTQENGGMFRGILNI